MADRIYSFISLAKRQDCWLPARKPARALKLGKVSLLIVSEDASAAP